MEEVSDREKIEKQSRRTIIHDFQRLELSNGVRDLSSQSVVVQGAIERREE